MIQFNPVAWSALPPEEADALGNAHADFIKAITESGEMISTHALADPTNSVVVRVKDGAIEATDGPYAESKEFLGGYYLVDCESKERAIEVAAMIPDAHINAIEVRPVMFSQGQDM